MRHAIAAERGPKFPDDRLRPLTPEGAQKFKDAVRGLASLNVVVDMVLTSPLVRAQETATILASGLGRRPIEEVEALAPGGRHAAIVEAIAHQAKKYPRLALVGHEPDLGELVMRLLGARGTVKFKKGAVLRASMWTARRQGDPGRSAGSSHRESCARSRSDARRRHRQSHRRPWPQEDARSLRRRSRDPSLATHGYSAEVVVTESPTDASRFARDAVSSGAEPGRRLGRRRHHQRRRLRAGRHRRCRWGSCRADRATGWPAISVCRASRLARSPSQRPGVSAPSMPATFKGRCSSTLPASVWTPRSPRASPRRERGED